MGRKLNLTELQIEVITEFIRLGNYAVVACRLTGVCERTYYHWLKLGKEPGNGIYSEFYDAVEMAEAEREAGLVLRVTRSNDLKAAMWMLERIAPERWGAHRARAEKPFAVLEQEESSNGADELPTSNPVWMKDDGAEAREPRCSKV